MLDNAYMDTKHTTFKKVGGDEWMDGVKYRSADGRFIATKRMIAASRIGTWRATWDFVDTMSNVRLEDVGSLSACRQLAEES